MHKFTYVDFNRMFPSEKSCVEFLFNKNHKDTVCPSCKQCGRFHKIKSRKVYSCACGGHQICPTANTIFHKSRTPLKTWFFVVFLFSQSKNGVSAKEVQRMTGVTYKTAWRMCKHVRSLMEDGKGDKFMGTVEMDETYVGGKGKGTRGRGAKKKTPVFGIVERQGDVRAYVTPNVKSSTVMPLVKRNVEIDANVMTDEYGIYNKLENEGYAHRRIKHKEKKYVFGDVHTNTIEGFWSQLKRGIHGTYHAVSPSYLQSYVDEFAFRWNHRQSPSHIFYTLAERVTVNMPC